MKSRFNLENLNIKYHDIDADEYITDLFDVHDALEGRRASKRFVEAQRRKKEMRKIWTTVSILLTFLFFAFAGYGLYETALNNAEKHTALIKSHN